MGAPGLGLDGGGSATRWALSDAGGRIVAAGELPGVTGHLFDAAARGRFDSMAAALAAALPSRPGAVVAGITGLAAGTDLAATAIGLLSAALGVPAAAIAVETDIRIAFRALFRPGEGHIVYAGTGSIGLHIAADGREVRAGGRGMLVDDAGSAFWIGRRALDEVWRARDLDPAATSPLATALDGAIGGADWDTHRAYIYGGGRDAVAQLARAVAACGDPVALGILRDAGGELARLARALVARACARPVALTGRAASLHPAIEAGFRAAAPDLQMSLAAPDAAAAAARLAAGAEPAQA